MALLVSPLRMQSGSAGTEFGQEISSTVVVEMWSGVLLFVRWKMAGCAARAAFESGSVKAMSILGMRRTTWEIKEFESGLFAMPTAQLWQTSTQVSSPIFRLLCPHQNSKLRSAMSWEVWTIRSTSISG